MKHVLVKTNTPGKMGSMKKVIWETLLTTSLYTQSSYERFSMFISTRPWIFLQQKLLILFALAKLELNIAVWEAVFCSSQESVVSGVKNWV